MSESESLFGHMLALVMLKDVERVFIVRELDDYWAITMLLMLLEQLVDFALRIKTVNGFPNYIFEVRGAFHPGKVSLVRQFVEFI